MPYMIQHNEQEGIIVVTVRGDFDLPSAQAALKEVIATIVETQCFLMLSDLREANITISVLDIFTLPGMVEEISAKFGLNPRHVRRAIVTDQQMRMKFYENVFLNRGYPAVLFDDMEKAKAWLHGLK